MRQFVAVWPAAEAVGELRAAVAPVASTTPTLRWVPPHQWHLTLTFLGDVDDIRGAELWRRLARVGSRHAPLSLRLAGAGRFGDRVLYLKVTGQRDPLRRLATSVSAAARRAQLTVEERSFRPHLTLARGRPGSDLRPAVAALAAYEGITWTVSQLCLVDSRPGDGPGQGPTYETVQSWPLMGS